jgi:hypothetical protein
MVRVDEAAMLLIIEVWTPERGVRRIERTSWYGLRLASPSSARRQRFATTSTRRLAARSAAVACDCAGCGWPRLRMTSVPR